MRSCPTCERRHPDGVERCPDDGTQLVAPQTDPLVGRELDRRFTLQERIGVGGMGAVYRALQHSMARSVAIKVLHPSGADPTGATLRFQREARALSRLSHPHTIRVFDFGQTEDGLLYLVMELLDGAPLSALVRAAPGGLDARRAVDLVAQACESVADAHRAGVLHRDLKPDNLFVGTRVGRADFVTVLDFGISKVLGGAEPALTGTGVSCGTPLYMSPEAALGQPVDGRADVYSLGVILYELLTGRPPFDGASATAVMLQQASARPPELPASNASGPIPAALGAAVARALSKEPGIRQPTPLALAAEIRSAVPTPASDPALAETAMAPTVPARSALRDTAPARGRRPEPETASPEGSRAEAPAAPPAGAAAPEGAPGPSPEAVFAGPGTLTRGTRLAGRAPSQRPLRWLGWLAVAGAASVVALSLESPPWSASPGSGARGPGKGATPEVGSQATAPLPGPALETPRGDPTPVAAPSAESPAVALPPGTEAPLFPGLSRRSAEPEGPRAPRYGAAVELPAGSLGAPAGG